MPQQLGLQKRATILRYQRGSVIIGLDEAGSAQAPQQFTVPMPLAWAGPNGEFMGGGPVIGSSVIVSQSQGGQWFIQSYIKSDFVFENGLMNALIPGRALIQVKNGYRIFVDPNIGIQIGDSENFIHADPNRDIFCHTFSAYHGFSDAARIVENTIKRDLSENSSRGILCSTLFSNIYDDSLYQVGLDPSAVSSISTSGDRIRNPALVEKREVIYEFGDSYDVDRDDQEVTKYVDNQFTVNSKLRRDNRTDTFSLSQVYPNHLIEIIRGTGVDSFGNVLDLNRNILPIGKTDNLSLRRNPDKDDAFARIKAQQRKALAYHFEINTKKGTRKPVNDTTIDPGAILAPLPDTEDQTDYARDRSRLFMDIDKEGQFKINIPSSSETGNIPLLTRYENYSVLRAKQDDSADPNAFIRNPLLQDIFLESFAGKATIMLSGSDSTLDGYESPIDRFTEAPIMMGTAYHDISTALLTFLESYDASLTPFDPSHNINETAIRLEQLISPTITVSGPSANAGGRSGLLNLDGFISVNIGANTIDRQSMWLDCAGGVVTQLGRDKNGISYAANLDGDMFIQIGGSGIGNSFDSRFTDQNDGSRAGKFDIRVLNGNGLMTIIRIEQTGVSILTPGRLDISAQQDIVFKSHGTIHLNAEQIIFFSDTASPANPKGLMRKVERKAVTI